MKKNLTVIIPVYNEEATVERIIAAISALPFVCELIVVDDASTDGTPGILARLDVDNLNILTHPENAGKTAAIKTALASVTGEITIIQDADLEYDPEEIEFLCSPIWEGSADIVYGSRFMVRKASRVIYFYHYLGNRTISFLSNLFTNKNMSDIETCYKVFRSFLLTDMPISSTRFGFEVEVTAKVSKTRARIYEAPISYYGRTYEQGKKIYYMDGVAALWYIIRYNLFVGRQTRAYVEQCNQLLEEVER
jgi:glycosyltransferase involved in cell wall biosynthesis